MERTTDSQILAGTPGHPLHFDALLEPHRSLTPHGFLIVMIIIAGVSFMAGLGFLLMGAWPVFGFFGLDVALIYYAFNRSYQDARARETIQLSDNQLKVRKVDAKGRVAAWMLTPYWTRVEIETIDEDEVSVQLRSHGRSLTVAHFLSPPEKLEFGSALMEALSRHRRGHLRGQHQPAHQGSTQ
ncbi:MAG: DUF2244 domain-containing protein [Parvibaculum sp.]